MNSQSLYAFYGSLRQGMSNYVQFQAGLYFLGTHRIPGYRLYAMKDYPYAFRSGDPADIITVEVFRITDPAVETAIHELELQVGYDYDEVEIEGQRVGIYLYPQRGDETLVKDGDWVKFFRP